MRFAVEEINNSTTLLPNVSLGYEIFDHCSNTKNFPSVLSFISNNGSIKPKEKLNNYRPKVIALTGPYGSTPTITIAPLITMDLIPLVNYGATSSVLSNTLQYPSFVRTIPSNKDLIEMIIHIIRWFGWNWVAFLGSQDDYSSDGLKLFNEYISNTGICLAYQESLSLNANYSLTLQKIDMLNINVIVVFAVPQYANKIIKAAIANNIQDKVWIASQAWAMNQQIPREPGIGKIGTIIGITERLLSVPGFNEFVYKDRRTTDIIHNEVSDIQSTSKTCNQVCDYCTLLTPEEIINENPTFSFAIYAAIYTIAHALHKVLQCDMNECRKNIAVKPYMGSWMQAGVEQMIHNDTHRRRGDTRSHRERWRQVTLCLKYVWVTVAMASSSDKHYLTPDDTHHMCVICLGEDHARSVLEGAECADCERISEKSVTDSRADLIIKLLRCLSKISFVM
ncbi:Taste receptor type 1 member 1 [Anabarilius grahami]|uniref:Taste receptor type 1 member 1 n=1 Tax=Anabarilius grahami TaxID=495550 RepID=A0A3N0YRM8_ANAGA|nr:Taste receptor type 1 member 1 [Anabarilius grahami]